MKLVMVSNFMNHHQLPLCNRLNELCSSFLFLCTESMPKSLIEYGYDDLSKLSYVKSKPQNEEQETQFMHWIKNADAVIYGACPVHYVHMRTDENKLSFIFSERMWKKGTYRRFIPFIRSKVTNRFPNVPNLYVLAASCYLPFDLSLVHFDTKKCFKWGYFTEVETFDTEEIIGCKETDIHIAWVGRFIPLKRCEDVLRAVGLLKRKGYSVVLDVVGGGPEETTYRNTVKKEKIEEHVKFWGTMPQSKVRDVLKKAQIFVFSSDFNEGWGAVVNEAMNSLCVPIVSHAVGSSGFLIQDGENGFLYQMGNVKQLASKIEYLINHPTIRKDMAIQAYETLRQEYNGLTAAERLVEFIDKEINKQLLPIYERGPMSGCTLIHNKWYRG